MLFQNDTGKLSVPVRPNQSPCENQQTILPNNNNNDNIKINNNYCVLNMALCFVIVLFSLA